MSSWSIRVSLYPVDRSFRGDERARCGYSRTVLYNVQYKYNKYKCRLPTLPGTVPKHYTGL